MEVQSAALHCLNYRSAHGSKSSLSIGKQYFLVAAPVLVELLALTSTPTSASWSLKSGQPGVQASRGGVRVNIRRIDCYNGQPADISDRVYSPLQGRASELSSQYTRAVGGSLLVEFGHSINPLVGILLEHLQLTPLHCIYSPSSSGPELWPGIAGNNFTRKCTFLRS